MLSLRGTLRRIMAGETTAGEELAACEQRIAAREDDILAFVDREERLETGDGPLAGIACAVKDIIDTADLPTRMGSPIYEDWCPRADAPIVSALKAAGATVAGKTHTAPFAFMDPAPTRNPHDLSATPGGSSSGSAAAVAAGMVPLALGTQTGGSIIRPAAFCGVAGIKPSFGLLPTVGVKTFSWTLDTLGLMAASADDLGLALSAIARRPELDTRPVALQGLRIGIHRQGFAGPAEPEAETALERVCAIAAEAGASLQQVAEDDAFVQANGAHAVIQEYEAAQALAWEFANRRGELPPKLAAYLAVAGERTAAEYDTARSLARRGRLAARDLFAGLDVLLTYSAPGEAPPTLESTGDPRFNRLWTLLGLPCVTIPVARGPRGLPVGVQIISGFGDDAMALGVAKALEILVPKAR
ncbi:MAG: amidase [Chelatococcus sp.]|nr:MAG: amidase [Chelatococcus sp.]